MYEELLLEEAVAATLMIGAPKGATAAVSSTVVRVVLIFVLKLFEHLLADLSHDGTTGNGAEGTHVATSHLVSGPASGSPSSHSTDTTFTGNGVTVLVVLHWLLLLLLLLVPVRLLLLLAIGSRRGRRISRLGAIASSLYVTKLLSAGVRRWRSTGIRRLRPSRI